MGEGKLTLCSGACHFLGEFQSGWGAKVKATFSASTSFQPRHECFQNAAGGSDLLVKVGAMQMEVWMKQSGPTYLLT